MSDSAALQGWRRRAFEAGGERRSPQAMGSVGAVLLGCVLVAVLGSWIVHARQPPAAVRVTEAPAPNRCAAVTSDLRADVDGDGCDDAISFADGVLTAGPRRLRVGGAGDQIALGRWTCGAVTVALLRPATGEVFRFDGWASTGAAVSAIALGRVDGAVGVRAAPRDGGRCDDVAVERTDGPPVLLPERPVAG